LICRIMHGGSGWRGCVIWNKKRTLSMPVPGTFVSLAGSRPAGCACAIKRNRVLDVA
jgi:hypothetical protein